jgi:hypothetical protein
MNNDSNFKVLELPGKDKQPTKISRVNVNKGEKGDGDGLLDPSDEECEVDSEEDVPENWEEIVNIETVFGIVGEEGGGVIDNTKIGNWFAHHGKEGMLLGNCVVLFVGKPGCGKTTLSYMMCYAYDSNIQVSYNLATAFDNIYYRRGIQII